MCVSYGEKRRVTVVPCKECHAHPCTCDDDLKYKIKKHCIDKSKWAMDNDWCDTKIGEAWRHGYAAAMENVIIYINNI